MSDQHLPSDTSADVSQSDSGSSIPPVDQALAERVVGLYQSIDVILKDMELSEDDRKQVEQNLMEAIAAELLTRLGDKMSDDDKEDLMGLSDDSSGQPNLQEVAGFFRQRFEQKDLVQALAESTEQVLTEFAESMQGNAATTDV